MQRSSSLLVWIAYFESLVPRKLQWIVTKAEHAVTKFYTEEDYSRVNSIYPCSMRRIRLKGV